MSVLGFVRRLKRNLSNVISKIEKHEIQAQNRKFWCGGYYVDTAGGDKNKIIYKKTIERRKRNDAVFNLF